uniref:Uncharacterized protein n=1 Tax=Anguilla anguilla TaxID=7936 RepID=A0A0E9RSI7_ANGAN
MAPTNNSHQSLFQARGWVPEHSVSMGCQRMKFEPALLGTIFRII